MDFAVLEDRRAALMLPTFSFSASTLGYITAISRSIPEWGLGEDVSGRVNRRIPNSKAKLKLCVMQNKCILFLNAKAHVGDPNFFYR